MKKIALLALLGTFVSACSSPPKPVEFPNTEESNLNAIPYHNNVPKVPLNRLDVGEWHYSMITHSEVLNESEKTKFWYLAHHATSIEIFGNYNSATELKQLMISNGVTAKIVINSQYPHSGTLSVSFAKTKPQANNQGATL